MGKEYKKEEKNEKDDEREVEGAEVDEDGKEKKKKLFANYQKNRIIPNITSVSMRPAGISKGLWQRELKS